MENWVKSKIWLNTYEKTKNFNGYTYRVSIIVEETRKSLKFWASISSGKKREDLEVYEEKDVKSKGGIKALIWCKNTILEFPKEYDADKKLKQSILEPMILNVSVFSKLSFTIFLAINSNPFSTPLL